MHACSSRQLAHFEAGTSAPAAAAFRRGTCRQPLALSSNRRVAVAAAAADEAGSTRQARGPQDLKDPAGIGAKARASAKVKDAGGAASLTSYMTLPVEQYFVLDPQQIRHISHNRFSLLVPRINLLNVWIEPEVEILASCTSNPPRVVLQAENCRIKGSQLIEDLKLDQRFCLRFMTELTWASTPSAKPGSSDGEIKGDASLNVWCEVVPPFNLMPKPALEASCNVVMAALVNSLLPVFVRKLAEDYGKWSADPEYRVSRAQRSLPLAEPLPGF